MGGTVLNVLAVLGGSFAGVFIGDRLAVRVQQSIVTALGLVTLYIGIDNAGQTGNIIIVLLSLLMGVIIGEGLRIDATLERLAGWLQTRAAPRGQGGQTDDGERERFIKGFMTASLLYCIGPLTILGSVQDGMGLAAGFQLLAVKSTLDAFASVAFAASFGIGVAFSALTVLIVQGGLAVIGSLAGAFMSDPMIAEMTATGGLMLVGLSLSLLEIKQPRIANFLPALVIAPLMVAVGQTLGIPIYPL